MCELDKACFTKNIVTIVLDAFKGCEKLKEVFYEGKRAD